MEHGASFSHRQLNYLDLDSKNALKEFKKLNLSWMRMSCYWDEIEKDEGKFNFESIEPFIKFCEKNRINVVLSVGMKAQRYPEYYLPSWLEGKIKTDFTKKITLKNNDQLLTHTLRFIEETIRRLKKYKCIKIWQVENEPLDPSGPNWLRIDAGFLEKEVNLVREIDPKRKILINLWGNELSIRGVYKQAIKLADIVGFDIYLRHPLSFWKFFTKYIGPLDSQDKIKEIGKQIKAAGKEFWIVELQAEPWEPNELVAGSDNPPSFKPEHFEQNLKYAKYLEPDIILFWGFEYWLLRKTKDDNRYWDISKNLLGRT
jgi:hypothetical protein